MKDALATAESLRKRFQELEEENAFLKSLLLEAGIDYVSTYKLSTDYRKKCFHARRSTPRAFR